MSAQKFASEKKKNNNATILCQMMLARWATCNKKVLAQNIVSLDLGYWIAFLSHPDWEYRNPEHLIPIHYHNYTGPCSFPQVFNLFRCGLNLLFH